MDLLRPQPKRENSMKYYEVTAHQVAADILYFYVSSIYLPCSIFLRNHCHSLNDYHVENDNVGISFRTEDSQPN